jgi:hypothetical protein
MGSPNNGNEVDVDVELLRVVLKPKLEFIPNNFWSPYDIHVMEYVKGTLLASDIHIDRVEVCARLETMQQAFYAFLVNNDIHIYHTPKFQILECD